MERSSDLAGVRHGHHPAAQADRVLAQALSSPARKEILDEAAMERAHLHMPEHWQDVAIEGLRVGDARPGLMSVSIWASQHSA